MFNKYSMTITAERWCRIASITGAVVLAVGCGGDSSDDDIDDNPNRLGGTWSGAMTRVSDTCNRAEFPNTFTFTNVVIQNESAIDLQDGTGIRYLGNAVGDNGFSVDASTSSAQQCNQARRIEYDRVDDNDDDTAETEFILTETCANGAACEVQYSGTASRTGGGTATPAPTVAPGTPAPTATPGGTARTGCLAMNPNTAAGVYQGNGGCGFSETKFSFSGESVVLNPLGSNGLTTFTVNAANTSSAASVRSDLIVQGDAGYGCSMVCSPPGTFTVTCNREGGTQCVEKF